ncbi:MAG: hypothetical protein AAF609_24410 [Cyanobacteria bacterium P01_C01_bin.120]
MSYSSFSLSQVKADFGIVTNETQDLYAETLAVQASDLLTLTLSEQVSLANAINTEKARSELIVMPIFMEVRRQLKNQIAVFSGSTFEVDPSKGLEGRCDFILSRSPEQYYIAAPIMTIVEAKNESIPSGLGQCIATMLAARLFNEREGQPVNTVYGAVTTGNDWKFLQLMGNTAFIDTKAYFINEVDKLIGILVSSLEPIAEGRPIGALSG